jgi:hypothetical protein
LTVGHGSSVLGEGASIIWTQVIVLAFIKVRWVMLDFMELRTAPLRLRALYEGWAIVVAAFLITTAWLIS